MQECRITSQFHFWQPIDVFLSNPILVSHASNTEFILLELLKIIGANIKQVTNGQLRLSLGTAHSKKNKKNQIKPQIL